MGRSLYDYCKENDRTELLDQWDEAGNLPRTPQTVSYGSHYKAQWRCEAGHTWRAQIFSRDGTPRCRVRRPVPAEKASRLNKSLLKMK